MKIIDRQDRGISGTGEMGGLKHSAREVVKRADTISGIREKKNSDD